VHAVCVAPEAQSTVIITSMVLSWTFAEVTRYTFYAIGLLKIDPPAFLVWMRYSLFMVLYPTGISSEIISIYFSLGGLATWGGSVYMKFWCYLTLLYLPGTPILFGHMLKLRKKRLFPPPAPPPPSGVQFPLDPKGKRSTTQVTVTVTVTVNP
jgi:very-long-chain (3R)-3-hydroxyacyl-CoA dehydratase